MISFNTSLCLCTAWPNTKYACNRNEIFISKKIIEIILVWCYDSMMQQAMLFIQLEQIFLNFLDNWLAVAVVCMQGHSHINYRLAINRAV